MLQVRNLIKTYRTKKSDVVYALNDVSIDFPEKGMVFLLGKSGSGKSTLLNAIGGLDKFDSGEIVIKGKSSKDFSQSDFDSYRNTFIGFIFQEYNILENFTVSKNLALALELQGKKATKEEVNKLLEQVDMLPYANRKPNQLSGGQKQRVAIARALIKNPEIIMADEPTGALDSTTGKQVMDTLKELSKTKLIIIVSHDREFAEIYGDRIIELKDGKIIADVTKKEIEAKQTKSGIKIIDDKLLYLKKGQEVSDTELKKIAEVIKSNTQNSDMFISFDDGANQKLKEGAKINDSGNKEDFFKTEPEDILQKQYSGKDLKLIRSKLKFKDSFKMGASSLKSKVGKLIFTIILSVFAFTMFGVIDTFANWNRGTSVYDSLKKDNITTFTLKKQKYNNNYAMDVQFKASDVASLKEKFGDYGFVPISYVMYNTTKMDIVGVELDSNVANPAKQFVFGSFASITTEQISKLGFNLEGRLPASNDEVVITKHQWTNAKELNRSLTSWSGLSIRVNGAEFKVVGVLDEKSDLTKYKNADNSQYTGNNSYAFSQFLASSSANTLFTTKAFATSRGSSSSNSFMFVDGADSRHGYNIDNFKTPNNIGKTLTSSNLLVYAKSGETIVLEDDEIILPDDYLSGIDNFGGLIEAGNLKFKITEDYDGNDVLFEFKVVGAFKPGVCYSPFITDAKLTELKEESANSFDMLLTSLKGSASDEEFVKYCETYHNNIRFTVQTYATYTLNTFESIIDVFKSVLLYVAIGFAVFTSLMLMNFIATSINYKKREIGVLRALGARGKDVFGIFFNEATIIAFINFILSTIASFIICMVINNVVISKIGATIVLLSFGLKQILLLLAISWGSAFLASFIPTMKISKKKPIDAIQNR